MSSNERYPGEYKDRLAAAAAAAAVAQPIAAASSSAAAAAPAAASAKPKGLDDDDAGGGGAGEKRDEKDKRYDYKISDPDRTIKFTGLKTGYSRTLTRRELGLSGLFRTTLDGDPDVTEFFADTGSKYEHDWICNYLEFWNGRVPPMVKKPLASKILSECTTPENAKFADDLWNQKAQDEKKDYSHRINFADMWRPANYLELPQLFNLLAAKLATIIKGLKGSEVQRAVWRAGPVEYDRKVAREAKDAAGRKQMEGNGPNKRIRPIASSSAAAAAAAASASETDTDDDVQVIDRKRDDRDYKAPAPRVAAAAATSVPVKKVTKGSRTARG